MVRKGIIFNVQEKLYYCSILPMVYAVTLVTDYRKETTECQATLEMGHCRVTMLLLPLNKGTALCNISLELIWEKAIC